VLVGEQASGTWTCTKKLDLFFPHVVPKMHTQDTLTQRVHGGYTQAAGSEVRQSALDPWVGEDGEAVVRTRTEG